MRFFEDRVSGPVAQLVEHRPFKAGVLGSNPSRLTSYKCSYELHVCGSGFELRNPNSAIRNYTVPIV